MKVKANFSEKQPNYRYMPIGNDLADVFIYKFIEEEISEEDGSTSFLYEQNEFRININEITEEMIKESPLYYLDYSNEIENINLEDRISAIEGAIVELAEVLTSD